MENLQKSPPWETFYNEVAALFDGDHDVKIEKDYTDEHKRIKLLVSGKEKAEALGQLLPDCKVFGNVAVFISVNPDNDVRETLELIEKAFDGNPNVWGIKPTTVPGGGYVNYIVMSDKIVQFYDDDLTSYCGAKTMLLEEAAKDVFGGINATYFCTKKL